MERHDLAGDKKKADERKALIFFADEACFSLLPNLVKSYFRKGMPTWIKRYLRRAVLNVISAISPCGELVYQIRSTKFLGRHIRGFLEMLLKKFRSRKIILIWDGAAAHSSAEVKELLRLLKPHRLELYKIPPHSPELNVDEQVWKYLKCETDLRNLACKSFNELKKKLIRHIENLKNNRERIIKMFHHPECAYIKN